MKSTIVETIDSNVDRVWKVVTSLDDFTWRSDISNIEMIGDNHF